MCGVERLHRSSSPVLVRWMLSQARKKLQLFLNMWPVVAAGDVRKLSPPLSPMSPPPPLGSFPVCVGYGGVQRDPTIE